MINRKNIGVALLLTATLSAGCVSTSGTAMEAHKKGMEGITEEEYVVAKKPIDRHFIGAAWSKQFGPVEDPTIDGLRVKKERSFSGIQENFAYNAGLALGARPVAAPVQGEAGIQGGSLEKTKLGGLEIITPVSLGDIPFELDIPYITEALRLANFKVDQEKANKAGINVSASSTIGTATAVAEIGSKAKRGTEGDGLVVAYKLNVVDKATYEKKESGPQKLELNKATDFANGSIIVKARLQTIEPGANKPLPNNAVWACTRASAKIRDIVAAWLIDVKPLDPKRKSQTIAFPAWPKIDDCSAYGGVLFSRIDPVSDKIHRQKINIIVVDAELDDAMRAKQWDARISVTDESFKIKQVKPADL